MADDKEKDIKNYKKIIQSLQKDLRSKDIIIKSLTESLSKKEISSDDNSINEIEFQINNSKSIKIETKKEEYPLKESILTKDNNKFIDFSNGFDNFQTSSSNSLLIKKNKKVKFNNKEINEENKQIELNLLNNKIKSNDKYSKEDKISKIKMINSSIDININRKTYIITGVIEKKNLNLNLSSCYEDFFSFIKQRNFLISILTIFCNYNSQFTEIKQKELDPKIIINDMLNIKRPENIQLYLNKNKNGLYKYFLRNIDSFDLLEIISFYLVYSNSLTQNERINLLIDFLFYSKNKDFFIFIVLVVMGSFNFNNKNIYTNKTLRCILFNEIKEINISKFFKIEIPGRNFSIISLINFIKDIYNPINNDLISYLETNLLKIKQPIKFDSSYIQYLEDFKISFLITSSYLDYKISYEKILIPFFNSKINQNDPIAYYFISNFLIIFYNNIEFRNSNISIELYNYLKLGLKNPSTRNICSQILNMMGVYYSI